MPLGKLILIVLAVLIAAGHGPQTLKRLHLSPFTAFVIVVIGAFGSGLAWTVPAGPPIRIDLGTLSLAATACWLGLFAARSDPRDGIARYGVSVVVTSASVYFLHRVMPHEPGLQQLLDPGFSLGLMAGVIAAISARQPAQAMGAAAAAYTAALIRDWSVLRRGGFVTVPLDVGAQHLDTLVFSLALAGLLATMWAAIPEHYFGRGLTVHLAGKGGRSGR